MNTYQQTKQEIFNTLEETKRELVLLSLEVESLKIIPIVD